MSLSQRTEMRRCGKRYATEDAARCSKLGLRDDTAVITCWVPGCGKWHVVPLRAAAGWSAGSAAVTGPSRKVRALVIARDGARCVCCGRSILDQQASLQHRDARGMGGTSDPHANCPCNLILLLGSGTTGCHGRVESREDPHDNGKGYWLRNGEIPALTSVMVFTSPGGSGVSAYPTCDGQWSDVPGSVAA
jgi:hypothetical protein